MHIAPYQPNNFLHPQSTLQALSQGALPLSLVLAVQAVSARLSDPPEPAEKADVWAKRASDLVLSSNTVTRTNVQTALLLGLFYQQTGRFTTSQMWCFQANRQALSLKLHRPNLSATRTALEMEEDRRLLFACYSRERQISDGSPESICCPVERIRTRFPCDDTSFYSGLAVLDTPEAVLEAAEADLPVWMYRNVGLMGFHGKLVGIRYLIKRYLHALAEDGPALSLHDQDAITRAAPWLPGSPFHVNLARLAFLKSCLPARLILSRRALTDPRVAPASLGPLIMFYMWWNECHLELCRLALPGYAQSLDPSILSLAPSSWVSQTRETCRTHASAMTATMELATTGHLTIYDPTLPRLIYSSIRLQLECAQSSVPSDLDTALALGNKFERILGHVQNMGALLRPAYLLVGAISPSP